MKRIIMICSVLALLSTPLPAAETGPESAGQGSAQVEEQVRIITGIQPDSFTFGRDTYQIAETIEYYSEEGGRVTKVFFHEEDGVLIKVVDDRTIIYMKKMPY